MCPNDSAWKKAGAVKLIVCDLDGTLLNSKKMISPATLEAVRSAQERGLFVTICSGRIPEMMEAYVRLLGIRGPVIGANGAVITDSRTGGMIFKKWADGKSARLLLEFCARRGLDHIAAASSGCFYSAGSKRIDRFRQYNHIAREEDLREIPLVPFGSGYANVEGLEIYKILVSGLSPAEQKETEAFIETLPLLGFTSSEPALVDTGAAETDKGTGVQNLARIMGFTKEEICVFGDYRNDIPMFEAAGFPVAMGNGDETVKNRAAAVTGTNDEDGIALAIKKYFLGD